MRLRLAFSRRSPAALARVLLAGWLAVYSAVTATATTRHVLLVTIDGLRWQEVFRGADDALINKEHGGVPDNTLEALKRDFTADSPEARRQKLMPFLWSTVATQGQLFGNRDRGSTARVLNTAWVSYPGYSELLTGRVDPAITTNGPIPNPNVTVLEWLNGRPGFAGRVAACAEWGVFTSILNPGRSRLTVWVTRQHSPPSLATPRLREIEQWMDDIPPITPDEHFDAFVYRAALEIFDTKQPRVMLLAFGEPDAWAHQRRYDRYLYSIQRCDRFVREFWEKLQALPEYRGQTTLILTPDHGRGVTPQDWTSHGAKVPRSDETWLAALGPDTPARGERRDVAEVHQAQAAATIAALLREPYHETRSDLAAPIADLIGGASR